jgi:hypothetical protein
MTAACIDCIFLFLQKQAADLLEKEKLRFQSTGVKCSKQQLNAAQLDKLRITDSVSIVVNWRSLLYSYHKESHDGITCKQFTN